MAYYDEQLRQLQQQSARNQQLNAQLEELYAQRQQLQVRVEMLAESSAREQADVDRLEGHSLAAFFYGVIGKMDEKLDQERAEAYAARVKYDAAVYELSQVQEDIQRGEEQRRQLVGCEQRYEELLREKAEAVKSTGSADGVQILKAETYIGSLESQQKELSEAVAAAQTALATLNGILDSLEDAEGWGVFDLLGGGLVADLAKHSHLDEAQEQVMRLQDDLRRLKTELADVAVQADMQLNVDGFLRFADYFFDGLFVDWAVLDRINQSQEQIQNTKEQLEEILKQLYEMQRVTDRDLQEARKKLDQLILKAEL